MDRGGEKCCTGLLGVEAGVSRELADWTGSAGRLSSGNAGVVAATTTRSCWTLHDGTDAGEPTGGAGRAGRLGGGRCRRGSGSDRGGNSCSDRADKPLTTEGTEVSPRTRGKPSPLRGQPSPRTIITTGETIITAGTGRLGETVDEIEAVVVRKLTWRLVPFLFLLYIVAYLDRINVGFAALQMRQQLAFTDAVYGLGAGTFFAGYFFFQVPSNLALQRVGARRWIALLMMVWGVISASMVLVSGPRSFYLLRFLLGAAEAGFFPGIFLFLEKWFPARARARTVARFMTAAPLSGVVGGPLSGPRLGLRLTRGLAGWQWMFLLEGIPAVVLGGVVLGYLVDRPGDADWLPREERDWLGATGRRAEGASRRGAGGLDAAPTAG